MRMTKKPLTILDILLGSILLVAIPVGLVTMAAKVIRWIGW